MTHIMSLICSVFQFSGLIMGNPSVSYKNPYFDLNPQKSAIMGIIGILVGLELIYLILTGLGLWRIYSSQNLKTNASLFYVLSVFRVVVSKVFFLPIFHLLSYSISCHFYQDLGEMRCSVKKALGCILTPTSRRDGLEGMLVVASVFALFWHTASGLFSELLDFSFRASDSKNHPK